ncbi:MAG: Ribosomal RNA small subunit methyltransferase H [Candidatus Nomurabacteria bacterium GW2011_GWF2_35_66]|uniref:Ribosomal RNA small subunit methyltransferase H n=1 Tax=Candidatus Nomurabacteria bacterium GW2011_GWE1_35_16 TaxID=1618761 RepID=A0A0G0B9Z3_9BACT|nr:MAG: Ribosomal RNA small subunit methyltransferase H [Candidatus Nomurabacteria bacterium GW2011_GWF1_34_20]KKP62854.1 MAG: Ribosomal RNA small subunit methyltransferase H [Candidatus Nomurabacteria bacterium GW2011_GWE2_34_25]KKP66253.1 MAG: Ribosomal RNA small subunit methyltransferase H [Candidatus Nomurabacteria bacterium GW2011_GWE1_35_16]KKP83085.1 MAG: Ribosomal RNA small subunit methyltransferase H [Candidatus Nomurabacteria bacterium GW2011_GWF2_35_66]HAE36678.1 16S rRNA (cytosine(1
MNHIPVLKDESIDGLAIESGDIIIDGTLGGGGHTSEMIKRHGASIKIIGLDLDSDALARTKELIGKSPNDFEFINAGFQDIDKVLKDLNIEKVDGILLDLGISSFQLEVAGRGFSFLKDEPLLMTMKKNPTDEDLTAKDIVNIWGEESIANIIYGFGEEKYSRKIAKKIVEARIEKEIVTTFDLVKIIDEAVGKNYIGMRIHPATRTFQALRIATNSELSNLEQVIEKGFNCLKIGGRMSVITFHSLEDRIVKRAFVALREGGKALIINKKPIIPQESELKINPRSRSAKLRLLEKI